MKRFLIILQFMTRIPINKSFNVTREDYAKGTKYFPLVGLIVGGITALTIYLCSHIFSLMISSLIGLVVSILITGGIHLDGFSDTCDGIFSGRNKEKILEIMKDSRLGTFGGIGLILLILSRFMVYFEILSNIESMVEGLSIILLAPVISRGIVMFFTYKRKYAREKEGLGDLFIGKTSLWDILINQIVVLFIACMVDYRFLVVYLIVLGIMVLIRNYIEKIIGGVTGDILGFSIEFSEILFMILTLGMVNYL